MGADTMLTAMTTVVVADDHELVRRGLRLLIEAEPDLSVVGEAEDGLAAIEAVERLRPDILLLDLRMPRMDGIEACARVRESCPDTRVVVLTSFDDEQDVIAALRAGASSYILKDTSPDSLVQSLRGVASGSTVLDPSITSQLLTAHAERRDPSAELLSTREREVLAHMAAGLKNREIAQTMWISENTVKTHVAHVISKLGQRDRTQAVVTAIKRGLVEVGRG